MHMFESEARVLSTALELAATLGSDPNHSVAAAAMDTRGRVYVGVNMYHFTGGPCAELVVLGVAAAAGAGQLMTIAAAGDGGRGSMAPCGRCRQVLLDTHPDVVVVVPGESGPELKPIHELLPSTYRFPDAAPKRILRFNKRYFDEIVSGTKQLTTRYMDPIALGPATLVFEDDEQFRTIDGMVDCIRSVRLDELTDDEAQREGVASAELLRQGLRCHYPQLPDDAIVEVVEFHVLS